MYYKNREEQPKVFRKSTLIYPVTLQELPNGRGSVVDNCILVPLLDLKRFKEAIVLNGMHSTFLKQMLNSWSVCYRIISNDWKDLVNGVLETETQLQWSTCFRVEAKIVEQMD